MNSSQIVFSLSGTRRRILVFLALGYLVFALILVAIAFQLMYGFVKDAATDWFGLVTSGIILVIFFILLSGMSLYTHKIRLFLRDDLPEHLTEVIQAHRVMWTRLGISALLSTVMSILSTAALLYSKYLANQMDL